MKTEHVHFNCAASGVHGFPKARPRTPLLAYSAFRIHTQYFETVTGLELSQADLKVKEFINIIFLVCFPLHGYHFFKSSYDHIYLFSIYMYLYVYIFNFRKCR